MKHKKNHRRHLPWLKSAIYFALIFIPFTSLHAQDILNLGESSESKQVLTPTQETIVTRRTALDKSIRAIQEQLHSIDHNSSKSALGKHLRKVIGILEQQRLYTEQQLAVLEDLRPSRIQIADFESKLAELRSESDDITLPTNFADIEKLRDELDSLRDVRLLSGTRLESVRGFLEEAKRSYEEKEKARRETKASLSSSLATDDNHPALQLRKAESELAQAIVILRRLELELIKTSAKRDELRASVLSESIALARPKIVFSKEQLEQRISEIELAEVALQKEQETTKAQLETAEKSWLIKQTKTSADSTDFNSDIERLEASKALKTGAQIKLRLLSERLSRLSVSKNTWTSRYRLFNDGVSTTQLAEAKERAGQTLDRLNREQALQLTELDELRKRIIKLNEKISAATEANSSETKWLEDQKSALERLSAAYDKSLTSIGGSARLQRKYLAEIKEHLGDSKWSELSVGAWEYFGAFWNYEVFSSNDYPVTVGKLIFGLFLFIIGYFASGILSRKFAYRVLSRFNLTQGGTAAIQSLTFYILFVSFTLVALRIVNVPLTVFTVLGGAIAIGIGFGSQNIMNNFISGLILLTEQPIRVGDLIEVENFAGTVKKIGGRSTIVRTGTNIDIIVPNSSFLEKNVVNWTRSNSKVRLKVGVGVVYGSPTDVITDILLSTAKEHERVIESPKPFVWFMDFGDNSLNFEVHFWASVRSTSDRYQIESEFRYRIEELCREHSIVIAFPQRDVHLDTNKPLEIKLLKATAD